jgi:hypothetical protein
MKKDSNIFQSSTHLTTEQLLNYLRHNMESAEAHGVERHLTDCEFCSDALEGLKNLDRESSMQRISNELHKMARSRFVVRKKLFTRLDVISISAVAFIIFLLTAIALLFFMSSIRWWWSG